MTEPSALASSGPSWKFAASSAARFPKPRTTRVSLGREAENGHPTCVGVPVPGPQSSRYFARVATQRCVPIIESGLVADMTWVTPRSVSPWRRPMAWKVTFGAVAGAPGGV